MSAFGMTACVGVGEGVKETLFLPLPLPSQKTKGSYIVGGGLLTVPLALQHLNLPA